MTKPHYGYGPHTGVAFGQLTRKVSEAVLEDLRVCGPMTTAELIARHGYGRHRKQSVWNVMLRLERAGRVRRVVRRQRLPSGFGRGRGTQSIWEKVT